MIINEVRIRSYGRNSTKECKHRSVEELTKRHRIIHERPTAISNARRQYNYLDYLN